MYYTLTEETGNYVITYNSPTQGLYRLPDGFLFAEVGISATLALYDLKILISLHTPSTSSITKTFIFPKTHFTLKPSNKTYTTKPLYINSELFERIRIYNELSRVLSPITGGKPIIVALGDLNLTLTTQSSLPPFSYTFSYANPNLTTFKIPFSDTHIAYFSGGDFILKEIVEIVE